MGSPKSNRTGSRTNRLQAMLGFLAISALIVVLAVYTSTRPPVSVNVPSMKDSNVFVYTIVPDPGNKGCAINLIVVDKNGTTYVVGDGGITKHKLSYTFFNAPINQHPYLPSTAKPLGFINLNDGNFYLMYNNSSTLYGKVPETLIDWLKIHIAQTNVA